jgi:hypothetical protein
VGVCDVILRGAADREAVLDLTAVPTAGGCSGGRVRVRVRAEVTAEVRGTEGRARGIQQMCRHIHTARCMPPKLALHVLARSS